jgi:UDP-N-acetylglucosamine 1-carboxyvinyltransferase
MDALRIIGPARLKGTVRVSGSKNTALPLLFSSVLFDQPIEFENVPRLWDIETTLQLLGSMGAQWSWDKDAGTVRIDATIQNRCADYEWVRRMRAGILALGPLIARYGEAKVSLPGGCAIGARPVDYHLAALEKMGVVLSVDAGYIHAKVPDRLVGAECTFPRVTVTGTENLLMVGCFAEGTTILHNAAQEPEVVALGKMLQKIGAEIEGLGTGTIRIVGHGRLRAPRDPVRVPSDRIEAGTWIASAAATRSAIRLEGCDAGDLSSVLEVFRQMGMQIEVRDGATQIDVEPSEVLAPVSIETAPFPGFPTDMQAQLLAALCTVPGQSKIRETIFENRFLHVAELRRLGARIDIDGSNALVYGGAPLNAAPLMATDLRASASLVIGALAANGESVLRRIYHLDRGYQRLDRKLRDLGVEVVRFSE